MNRRFLKNRAVEEPAINLTPLIDVVFVILIMFIVIAPLLELDRIELAKANANLEVSLQESSPIKVQVYKDNAIAIQQKKVNADQLLQELKLLRQMHPTAKPQLFHDKQAFFGTYQAVKNAIEMAGFQEMDVVLNP